MNHLKISFDRREREREKKPYHLEIAIIKRI